MRREKPLLPLDGRPLIAAIVEQIRPCFPTLMISTGDRNKFTFLGLPVVEDEAPGQGPLLAILSALRASPRAVNFILACDIPVVHIPFLQMLLAKAAICEIIVPATATEKPNHFSPSTIAASFRPSSGRSRPATAGSRPFSRPAAPNSCPWTGKNGSAT